MNVLLSAQESAGVQALRLIAAAGHHVAAVLTTTSSSRSAVRGAPVDALTDRLGYAVLPAELVTEPSFADEVRRRQVDVILNVHSLFLMHPDVASSARIGAFNLHPGPLPGYAGLNSPSWAILHGQQQHGVTLHWMDAGIDTGPIAYQSRFPITASDTGLTVARRCVTDGLELVRKLLHTAASDPAAVPRLPQDLSQRSYYGRQVPHDGMMDWRWPARRAVAFVRACDYHPLPSPWGHPATWAGDEPILIARARETGSVSTAAPGTVVPGGDGVLVACADEWIEVTHVRRHDRRMSALEAIGHVERLTSVVPAPSQ